MNIKQKLTCAFAAIACTPVLLIAVVVAMNLRSQAQDDFIDSSSREIRQIDNAMQQFFAGISQNVEYLAKLPAVTIQSHSNVICSPMLINCQHPAATR